MKRTKRILLVLTLTIMMLCLTLIPKSLATGENLELTVSGEVAGRTISIYKLFDLKIDGENYYYTWDNLGSEGFFANEGYLSLYDATEYLKTIQDNSTELTNLAEKYYTYCKENGINAIDKKTAGTDATNLVFSGLDQGYYLVYDETQATEKSAKSAAIVSNLKENITIRLKVDKVEVDKEANTTTANVGETVNFTVTSKVPQMIGYDKYTFTIEDTLSKGLDFNDDISIKIGDTSYTAYTKEVKENNDGTTTITIDFTNFIEQKINAGKDITITYSAKLNSEAATEKDNNNSVKAIYSNDPTDKESKGETPPTVVHVYTYEIDLTKINSDNETLKDAKFILQLEDGTYAKFTDGVYSGCTQDKEQATELTTNDNGKVTFSGIKAGKYKLIETESPEGYNLPDFTFDFEITQELNDNGILEKATFDYTADTNNKSAKGYIQDVENTSASFAIEVLNAKKGVLPSTGGAGTFMLTTTGVALMVTAGGILILKNRKQVTKEN